MVKQALKCAGRFGSMRMQLIEVDFAEPFSLKQ